MTLDSLQAPAGPPQHTETSYSCNYVFVVCPRDRFLPVSRIEFKVPDGTGTLRELLLLANCVLGDDSSSVHGPVWDLSPPSSGMSGYSADRMPEGRWLQIKGRHKPQKIVITERSSRKGVFPLLCPKINVCSD